MTKNEFLPKITPLYYPVIKRQKDFSSFGCESSSLSYNDDNKIQSVHLLSEMSIGQELKSLRGEKTKSKAKFYKKKILEDELNKKNRQKGSFFNDQKEDEQNLEYEMIFKDTVHLRRQKKEVKKVLEQLEKNKFSEQTLKELNTTKGNLQFLKGALNYIFPKMIYYNIHMKKEDCKERSSSTKRTFISKVENPHMEMRKTYTTISTNPSNFNNTTLDFRGRYISLNKSKKNKVKRNTISSNETSSENGFKNISFDVL